MLNFIVPVGSGAAPPAPWHAQLNLAGPWGEEASRASTHPSGLQGFAPQGTDDKASWGLDQTT